MVVVGDTSMGETVPVSPTMVSLTVMAESSGEGVKRRRMD